MFGWLDFQESPLRFEATLPSLKVPLAVNRTDVPLEILGFAGLMVIETRCAVETVRPVEPLIDPKVALMVVLPAATLEARPCALMVAAAALNDVQVTVVVMSWVLLSLKVPVAVNCLVVPTAVLEFAGVMAIDTRVAAVTVSDAVPLTVPDAAVIVVVPVPVLVANPVASMLATEVEEEDHAIEVSNWTLPSSKLPTAVNWWAVPSAMDGIAGLTAMETRCAGTTVNVLVSLNAPTVAVMVVEPAATVVAKPEPLIVAAAVDEEAQLTPLDKSWLLPSLYVAVAVNCTLMPMPRVRSPGVTVMDTTLGAVTVTLVDWETPANEAETVVDPAATAASNPLASIVAVAVEEELHVTRVVRSEVLPSL
jgi:hypothetical protein